ncbi:MAG: hypothetical protein R2754_01595 [Microthrixaceae bacterium]
MRRIGVAAAVLAVALVACGCSDTSQAGAGTSTAPATSTSTPDVAPAHGEQPESGAAIQTPQRPTNAEFGGAERIRLGEQLVQAREVALALPTYGEAVAAGYEPTTPYAPGTGAHVGRDDQTQLPDAELDVTKPQSLMYAGTDPDSPVVGLMYVQLGGDVPPEGFAGPLDTWDPTTGQCLKPDEVDPMFPTAASVTRERCDQAGGRFLDITAWIQHVWVVPGWEAPGGVFAHDNDDIRCADGTSDSTDTDGCEPPGAT